MGATTQPTSFSDLFQDLLNRVRNVLGTTAASTANSNYSKRYINQANHDLHIQQNWWWAERHAVLQTHDTYTTGSVSVASTARTTAEGTNTAWADTVSGMGFNTTRAGGKLRFSGDNDVYVVSSVGSGTSITLADRYVGGQTTATAYALSYGSYTYFEDEYALASDYFRTVDVRIFSADLPIELISPQEFYRAYPRNYNTGRPRIATIIERGKVPSYVPAGADTDWEPRVMFHPVPDQVYNIPYRYITRNLSVSSDGSTAPNMSADTDEPIIPLRYRHVLVLYGLVQWYRDLKDDQRAQLAEQHYVDLVRRIANDSNPQRDHPVLRPRTAQYKSTSAGPYRFSRRRFSADTRFDELRD